MFLLASVSCRNVELQPPSTHGATWQRDVRPIAAARCLGCHEHGGVAPLDLSDPVQVLASGPLIAALVADRQMPPSAFDPACREPVGSAWLTDPELAAFDAWSRNGFALGDPADYVAPLAPAGTDPGPPDQVLTPPEPYPLDPTLIDDYRCLPIDPPLDRERYVTGLQVLPQNPAVAHHAVLFAFAPTDRPKIDALAAADPEPGYSCFGGPGPDTALTLGSWRPGSAPQFVPVDTAIRIPAGSTLVLSMHYNLSAATGDLGTDLPQVELWELPEGQVPDQVVVAYWLVMLGLEVPAGAIETETIRSRIPAVGRILSSTPHMHRHGTAIHTSLFRPDGDEVCVTDLPRWNFDWQQAYAIPDGQWIPVSIDDQLELSCTYDNSAGTTDLQWGDDTSDEMCLDYLDLVVPWDGGTTGGVCSGYPTCDASCAPDDPFCSLACMTSSGDACLSAGLDALFGPCVESRCRGKALVFDSCLARCAPHYEDRMGCLFDQCRRSLDAYWGCAKPIVDAGAPGCEGAFDSVPELLGGG